MGPTSVFILNEEISLYASDPRSIINQAITVKSGSNRYNRSHNEKHGKISDSTVACGVVELCDLNCQKSLSLAGAEI